MSNDPQTVTSMRDLQTRLHPATAPRARRTLRVGIASPAQARARLMAIMRGDVERRADEPKLWVSSIMALGQILSPANWKLLCTIALHRPESVKALAKVAGREPSNVLRTLRTLQHRGLVDLHPAGGRSLRPEVTFDRLEIVSDLEFDEVALDATERMAVS